MSEPAPDTPPIESTAIQRETPALAHARTVPLAAWLRRRLDWSNSVESWQEWGVGLLLLLCASVLVWFHHSIASVVQVVLWVLLLGGTALLLHLNKVKLFGPVLFYDLIRVGRRGRYVLFRTLYILAMLLVLVWWYWMTTFQYGDGRIPASQMGQFTESFFYAFLAGQLVVIGVLTPAYVAGAIADEKDRQTLEFVLATDLRSREIILGKLTSRLVNLMMILLAGLPVLSGLQFMGGVDPDLLLAGFAATGMTILSLASLGMLWSVYSRKGRDAILLTYLSVILYLGGSTFAQLMLLGFRGRPWDFGSWVIFPDLFGAGELTLGNVIETANTGNLLAVLIRLTEFVARGGRVADLVPDLLGGYAVFHGVFALVCIVWAIARLRPTALKERFNKVQRVPLLRRLLPRVPVGDHPMIWKEVFAEGGVRFNWLGRIVLLALVGLSLIPYAFIIENFFEHLWAYAQVGNPNARYYWRDPWTELRQSMNIYVRMVGTIVALLMLLAVGVRAAGAVTTERDKQTLDELLTSPLESSNIIFAKWLGSIFSVRWILVWLGLIVFPALVVGGLHPVALVLLTIAWLVYAGLFAAVGLLFSVRCRTTLQAAMCTLLTTIFVGGAHWMLTVCCFMPLFYLAGIHSSDATDPFFKLQAGMTPPFVLGFAAFQADDFEHTYSRDNHHRDELIASSVFGVFSFGVASLILVMFATSEFSRVTGRSEGFHPTGRPPPMQGNPFAPTAEEPLDVILSEAIRRDPPADPPP